MGEIREENSRRTSVSVIATEENERVVPMVMVSVLVMVRVGKAVGRSCILANDRSGGNEKRTRNTEVATRDEGASDCQHFRGHEGNIKRLGDGAALLEDVQEGLMTGLNGDDRGGSGQENGVGNEVSSSEVGRDTEVLNETGSGGHDFNTLESGVEVELAS